MMAHVTKEDVEMLKKATEWIYTTMDGCTRIKGDAPPEIKAYFEKIKNEREALDFEE